MHDNPESKILAIILESDAIPPTSELRALEIFEEPSIPNPKTMHKQFWQNPAAKKTANPLLKSQTRSRSR